MQKEYLILFQHGPVQEFIATARRTDDFWAGSFLLSHATAFVVGEIKTRLNGEVIFPDPGASTPGALEAALPNRVAAIVKAQDEQTLKSKLLEIKDSVSKALIAMFEAVEQAVTGKTLFSVRQINGFFEAFFVFTPYSETDHAACFAEAQTKLEARKNIRNFQPSFEYGFKCTQCGSREPLRANASLDSQNTTIHALRKYWGTLRSGRHAYSFKENEMLCAVCCGKRLLRSVHYPKDVGIPSTSAVAVAAWIDENSALLDDALSRDLVSLLKKTGLNWKCTPVMKNRERKKDNILSRPASSYLNGSVEEQTAKPLLAVEGDFFFPDSYDRLAVEVENGAQNHLVRAKQILIKLLKQAGPGPVPRYLAVLTFDADGMGDVLRKVSSKEEHQALTGQLTRFAAEVKQICHETFHGHVIYVGGDEGVVLIPLSEMLQVMEDLRNAFARAMKGRLTLSAGAAVIHHQSPLGQGIRAAQEAIKKAKAVPGKNAFAVTILKRSGSRADAVSPWTAELDGYERPLLGFLQRWLELYRSGSLSPRWFYQVRSILKNTKDERGRYRAAIAEKLLFRVLPRHANNAKTALDLTANTITLMTSGRDLLDFNKLVDLLYLPLYIFQGGDQ